MKKLILVLLYLLFTLLLVAQNKGRQDRKDKREEKKILITEKVDSTILCRNFTFIPQNANPVGWNTVNLTTYYDLVMKSDSVFVYLPFYGRIYQVNLMSTEGGIKLNNIVDNYKCDKEKNQYEISFEANSNNEQYRFSLSVFQTGYASLTVIGSNRQAISFYGIIKDIE